MYSCCLPSDWELPIYQRFTNLLLLVLNKLGDKQSKIVVDATLLEVANKLLLKSDIQSLELYTLSHQDKKTASRKFKKRT